MRDNDVIRAALEVSDRLPHGELTIYRENRALVIQISWWDAALGMRGMTRRFTKEEMIFNPHMGREYAETLLWGVIPDEREKYSGRNL
jgi:hypothetical protein